MRIGGGWLHLDLVYQRNYSRLLPLIKQSPKNSSEAIFSSILPYVYLFSTNFLPSFLIRSPFSFLKTLRVSCLFEFSTTMSFLSFPSFTFPFQPPYFLLFTVLFFRFENTSCKLSSSFPARMSLLLKQRFRSLNSSLLFHFSSLQPPPYPIPRPSNNDFYVTSIPASPIPQFALVVSVSLEFVFLPTSTGTKLHASNL